VLQVEVVSPERILYSGEAEMVVCRTPAGEIAFLTGHVPFLGALGIGQVRIHQEGGDVQKVAVHEGFVEVSNDHVTLLSDVAELPDQIDEERARRAKEEAEQRMKDSEDTESEAKLRRAQVRLDLAGG
jgi:F-type H+-transporting ATPase subunit epsilon